MLKNRFLLVLLLAGFLCTAIANFSYAGVPQMINYQSTLTDTNGNPVPNGNYNLEFKIYDVASGGAALWSEKWDLTTSQVTVVSGIFNVMLGFQTPIPVSFFADHPLTYLGIKVGTDSEMLPRQQITSVGYAFTAGNGVPKGGIIMWSGAINQIPDGWDLCDGTNGTPNLRDRFVVGAGSSYAVAATGGEATHILTVAEMPSHTHIPPAGRGTDVINNPGNYPARGYTNNDINYSAPANGVLTSSTGGNAAHNNLPPYYALAFIMKL